MLGKSFKFNIVLERGFSICSVSTSVPATTTKSDGPTTSRRPAGTRNALLAAQPSRRRGQRQIRYDAVARSSAGHTRSVASPRPGPGSTIVSSSSNVPVPPQSVVAERSNRSSSWSPSPRIVTLNATPTCRPVLRCDFQRACHRSTDRSNDKKEFTLPWQ